MKQGNIRGLGISILVLVVTMILVSAVDYSVRKCSDTWGASCSDQNSETKMFDTDCTNANGWADVLYIDEVYLNSSVVEYGDSLEVTCEFFEQALLESGTCYWHIYYRNQSSTSYADWGTAEANGTYACGDLTSAINKSGSFVVDNVTGEHQVRCAVQFASNDPDGCANLDTVGSTAADAENNDANFSVEAGGDSAPVVTLNSPADSSTDSDGNVIFNCSASDDNNLVNVSLYITNSTNSSFGLNSTTDISGTSNSTTWDLSLGNGNYTWNCLAYDNASQSDWGVNRSLEVSLNNSPSITLVNSILDVTLSPFITTTSYALMNVSDANGYADLNDSLAWCTFSKSGETSRTSSSCAAQDQSGNDLRYNCSVDMYYYDSAGVWNVSCYAEDISGLNDSDDSKSVTVNGLNYITQDVTAVNWSTITPGNNDQEAQGALVLTNGGNQAYTNFNISSQNITSGSDVIEHNRFMVDASTGQTTGQTYLNSSGVDWSEGNLSRCISPCSSNSTEEAYFYVDTPTGILPGIYTSISDWEVALS